MVPDVRDGPFRREVEGIVNKGHHVEMITMAEHFKLIQHRFNTSRPPLCSKEIGGGTEFATILFLVCPGDGLSVPFTEIPPAGNHLMAHNELNHLTLVLTLVTFKSLSRTGFLE